MFHHEGREDGHEAHEEILFSPQSHRGHGERFRSAGGLKDKSFVLILEASFYADPK
jgi:hypothetical protein